MNPLSSSKRTCQKEKCRKAKKEKKKEKNIHIHSLSPMHSWNISDIPFEIPVLVISASHWAKQVVRMHETHTEG